MVGSDGKGHRKTGRRERSSGSAREAAGGGRSAAPPDCSEVSERIARRLARAGIASRRDAEALIVDGRVRVNGSVISSPALNVIASDRIKLDGVEIPPSERTRLFLFHKPAGVVTTNRDPEGRNTVFDILPTELPRLVTVGRLDITTEGLLLLTNDGGLARLLELPSTGWLRRYRARVHGSVDEKALAELKNGLAVDGIFYGGIEASLDRAQGSNAWLTIGLREGKNREVKNVLGAIGLEVTRLIRISYGPFQLGELPEGAVQELKGRTLREQLGERLIEEAGANFEAPVVKPFPNRPVRKGEASEPAPAKVQRPREAVGPGGLIKRRSRHPTIERDAALARLSTQKGSRKGTRGRDEEQERGAPARSRKSNVWMAPGARPQGKRAQQESTDPRAADPTEKKRRPKPSPAFAKKPQGRKSRPEERSDRKGNRDRADRRR